MVTDAGEIAVIANGHEKDVLLRLVKGESVGTVFVPAARRLAPRQRWIVQAVRPSGTVVIDDGARTALIDKGRSLLPIGITDVIGEFEKGDVVVVHDPSGHEIARGLVNYSVTETRLIMGKQSAALEQVLGRPAYDEVVHRDNLVLTIKDR